MLLSISHIVVVPFGQFVFVTSSAGDMGSIVSFLPGTNIREHACIWVWRFLGKAFISTVMAKLASVISRSPFQETLDEFTHLDSGFDGGFQSLSLLDFFDGGKFFQSFVEFFQLGI